MTGKKRVGPQHPAFNVAVDLADMTATIENVQKRLVNGQYEDAIRELTRVTRSTAACYERLSVLLVRAERKDL